VVGKNTLEGFMLFLICCIIWNICANYDISQCFAKVLQYIHLKLGMVYTSGEWYSKKL